MLAAGMMAASVNAQNTAITSNKFGDNWYVGANVGVATPQTKWKVGNDDWGFMKGFAPKLGVRVGKNLTTVFGLAADADIYMLSKSDNKSGLGNKTFVNSFDLSLLGTFNLNNLFAGYQGEPRSFEVIALGGLGWGHAFGGYSKRNALTSKAALDFAFNLGSAKALQLYIEPAVVYQLQTWGNGAIADGAMKFDSRKGFFQLSAGVNYKFGNSNGTHNFVKANAKDGKIAADGRTIADLQAQLTACQNKPAPTAKVQVVKETTQLQPIVIFGVGKSTLDNAGYASCEMVAKYMRNHKDTKIIVKGYASPEGDAAKNQKLSEARANAVKNALVKRYKIAADRIEAQGLGATSEISEENDFNRVAMFFTK